jgi:hypothetical protein
MSLNPVQNSSLATFAHTYTATASLTGVTAGNTLISLTSVIFTDGSAPTGGGFTVSDGTTYTQDGYFEEGGLAVVILARLANATAGSHSCTVTIPSGTKADLYGTTELIEFPPLTLDQTATGGANSTTPSVGPTSALANANEVLIPVLAGGSLGNGGTFPPTGGPGTFTSFYNPSNTSDSCGDADYQVQSSGTSAVTVSWGTTTFSGKWAAALCTYYATASSNYSLSCAYGSFALTGIAATLTWNTGIGFTLLANPGAFDFVGAQAISQLSIYPNYGQFALFGQNVILSGASAYIMVASGGVFVETPGNANLTWFVSGSMPNFVGMDYYTATALAALLGLAPQTPVEVKAKSPIAGTVIAQSLAPNTVIVQGMPITFSVVGDNLLATAYNEPPM